MKHTCRAAGCTSPTASGYSKYCVTHKARSRRHGSPDQTGISKTALRPFIRRVSARIASNPENPAWTILEQRWQALIDASRGHVEAWLAGRPGSRIERTVAYEISKLHEEGKDVLRTTAAMFLMREEEPYRFVSDDAFLVQLSRRARGLSNMNFGESYDHTRDRIKRHYRDITPKAAILLGRTLAITLGAAGLHIARLEKSERDRMAAEKAALHNALSKLA